VERLVVEGEDTVGRQVLDGHRSTIRRRTPRGPGRGTSATARAAGPPSAHATTSGAVVAIRSRPWCGVLVAAIGGVRDAVSWLPRASEGIVRRRRCAAPGGRASAA
jgi:hypothetical protein